MLIQVPGSLADDLCDNNGWRVALAARSTTLEVALEVLSAGSNLVGLIGVPANLKASLETIRSWLRRSPSETTIILHSESEDIRIVIRDEADAEKAMAIISASLDQARAS